jgi:hypothetical protein
MAASPRAASRVEFPQEALLPADLRGARLLEANRGPALSAALWKFDSAALTGRPGARPLVRIPERIRIPALVKGHTR